MTRVVLVTGSTDGIGRGAARALAAGGMHVIVHGRSRTKVEMALAKLREELPGAELSGVAFDLGTTAGVHRGAEEVLRIAPQLHVLVNNAGIFAPERVLDNEGNEATFAVNFLAPFALTELLAPRLIESASEVPSRVIDVSSMAHTRGRIHLEDLQLASAWTGYAAYAQSKLALVMHAMSLADHHPVEKLVGYALHPGVIGTKLLRQGFGPVQGKSVEHGAKLIAMLAGGELISEPPGTYYSEGVATPPATAARDPQVRAQLWEQAKRLAHL